jgi:hypothetical protein
MPGYYKGGGANLAAGLPGSTRAEKPALSPDRSLGRKLPGALLAVRVPGKELTDYPRQ